MLASAKPERADIFGYDENSIAELFYTGGSTGTPKGVLFSHRTLYLHALSGAMLATEPETAVDLYTIPLFHANGWGHPHMATMLGIKQVLLRGFDPETVFALIDRHRATQMNLIPVMAHMLLQVPNASRYDCTSMRDIHVGGAPCSAQLVERMERLFPNARCITGYGLTETSPFLSYPPPKKTAQEEDRERRARQASVGWPVMGAALRLVDSNMRDVPRDGVTIGEIVAMGDNVMDGYYNNLAGTAAAISNHWLRTGDLGVWNPDGSVRFVDRRKDLIISGGENISSLEIETAIAAHPAVLECAVVAAPDAKWGERPVAIVVPKPDQSPTAAELLAFLRDRLAGFKLPREIEIREERLPRSSTLKVQKMRLREKYWRGLPTRVHGLGLQD
jgi:fatty-acyl-CoA synthase